MELSIVYDSRTGNTAFLARELARAFPAADCRRLEEAEGPLARRVCLGFWTDKGTCSEAVRAFLPALAGRRIFLFGTAGFGLSQAYFAQIIQRVAFQLPADARMEEWFMCQGRMGDGVRQRYEAMLADPTAEAKARQLLENFHSAASHPDRTDAAALVEKVRRWMER